MPPKPKFTRQDLAAAAYRLIRTQGMSALTARDLGKQLGVSSSPIFTYFKGMDEVRQAARELALAEFRESVSDYRSYTPAARYIGIRLVQLGQQEPEVFRLLFMQKHPQPIGITELLEDLGDIGTDVIRLLEADYGLGMENTRLLFEALWIQAFGMGSLCASGGLTLTEAEISRRLGMVFAGQMMLLRSGKLAMVFDDLQKNSGGTYHGIPVTELPFGSS